MPEKLKIYLAQIYSQPLKIKENIAKIKQEIEIAKTQKADLIIFPELSVSGYNCMDYFADKEFLEFQYKQTLELAKLSKEIGIVVGFVDIDKTIIESDGCWRRYNSIAIFKNEKLEYIQHKSILANEDIFYEYRYFKPDQNFRIIEIKGSKIGFLICADLWDNFGENCKPSKLLKSLGAQILINISASTFEIGKEKIRENLVKEKIMELKIPFIYLNLVGSSDGYDGQLIYDGNSFVLDQNGNEILKLPFCQESSKTLEIKFEDKTTRSGVACNPQNTEQNEKIPTQTQTTALSKIHKALIFGIKEYFKQNNFEKAYLGLSGGIDSSLVAVLLVEALGKENVFGIIMPTKFNSSKSEKDALELAKNLEIKTKIIEIQKDFENYLEKFRNLKEEISEIARQNLQARIRANYLMALVNSNSQSLLISTSNKTETALGYSTLYGDMSGALAPIGDLPKNLVYSLSEYLNQTNGKEIIPVSIIQKEPTAELSENQTDEKSLGANYEILSPLVEDLILKEKPQTQIEKEYGKELTQKIQKMILKNEFKRRQAPPAIKITSKSFGVGRRIPI